jgi:hypothetical protein
MRARRQWRDLLWLVGASSNWASGIGYPVIGHYSTNSDAVLLDFDELCNIILTSKIRSVSKICFDTWKGCKASFFSADPLPAAPCKTVGI